MTKLLLILSLILAVLFFRSFQPGMVLFSNDGPLSTLAADRSAMPENYAGGWDDLNYLGAPFVMPGPAPSIGLRSFTPNTISSFALAILGSWFIARRYKIGFIRTAIAVVSFHAALVLILAMIFGTPEQLTAIGAIAGLIFICVLLAAGVAGVLGEPQQKL